MDATPQNSVTESIERIEKEPIIKETIIPKERIELQPVIHRERLQTEIHRIIEPSSETQINPTITERRELPPKFQQGSGEYAQSTFSTSSPIIERIVKEPIVVENIRKRIIQEVQPIIYRDIIQTTTIPAETQINSEISKSTLTQSAIFPLDPNAFQIRVVEARGIRFSGLRETNPFIEVKLKGLRHIFHSEKQNVGFYWRDSDPIWNQDFILHPTRSTDVVQIRVWEHDSYLGKALLPVGNYHNMGMMDLWIPLVGKSSRSQAPGEIHVMVQFGEGNSQISNLSNSQSMLGNSNMKNLQQGHNVMETKTVKEYTNYNAI